MEHSFDIEFAKEHGINAAILYRNFQWWIAKNKANGHNIRNGRTWTYNSMRALSDLFPYMSDWDVRKALETLIKSGILFKANFNTKGYDRTTWYAFGDEITALKGLPGHLWNSQMGSKPKKPICESHTSICESHRPIPIPIPNIKPVINQTIEKSPQEILDLDLQIAEQKKFLAVHLQKYFHYFTKGEKRTFGRIINHLVMLTQQNPEKLHLFKDAVEWARQAKVSNAANKKGLFVAKIKQETGFAAQGRMLRNVSAKD